MFLEDDRFGLVHLTVQSIPQTHFINCDFYNSNRVNGSRLAYMYAYRRVDAYQLYLTGQVNFASQEEPIQFTCHI